jgi:hypothetical protein
MYIRQSFNIEESWIKNAMKKMIFAAVLLSVIFASGAHAQQKGWMSRYWDGCKPHCSIKYNVLGPNFAQTDICKDCCRYCDVNNNEIPINDQTVSSCEQGGTAYACWDQVPFIDPLDSSKAYAFAATPSDECGKCFELTFDGGMSGEPQPFATHKALQGKTLVVMGSNIGHDVGSGQFDVMVPGGGVGMFDSFSKQIGVNVESLGERYGGFLLSCEKEIASQFNWNRDSMTVERFQKCLRDKCDAAFSDPKHELLNQGCNFYADWFMGANNPTLTYKEVQCPEVLVNKYKHAGASADTANTVKRLDTIKVTAENITSQSGNTAIYTVDVPQTGIRKLVFSAASTEHMVINIHVNGTYIEHISQAGTGGANTYVSIAFPPDILFDFGENTIQIQVGSPNVKIDHILVIGEVREQVAASVRRAARVTKTRSRVTLKAAPRGFAATLPANHGYTSYNLINLQGREIRRGAIAAGATDLQFSDLRKGVLFLRLEGKNAAPAVLRATAF